MASPPFLSGFSGDFLRELAPLGSETAPSDNHGLGMRRQPIQPGGGQERIAKQVGPLRGSPVTGDQHAADFIALVHDIVEVRRGRVDQGFQPKVVEHEQLRAQIKLETLGPGPIGPATMEVLQHLVGVDEEHITLLSTRFMGEGLREVAVADPRGATDQYMAFLTDVVTARQVEHLLPVGAGVEVPLEALQGFGGIQRRPSHP